MRLCLVCALKAVVTGTPLPPLDELVDPTPEAHARRVHPQGQQEVDALEAQRRSLQAEGRLPTYPTAGPPWTAE